MQSPTVEQRAWCERRQCPRLDGPRPVAGCRRGTRRRLPARARAADRVRGARLRDDAIRPARRAACAKAVTTPLRRAASRSRLLRRAATSRRSPAATRRISRSRRSDCRSSETQTQQRSPHGRASRQRRRCRRRHGRVSSAIDAADAGAISVRCCADESRSRTCSENAGSEGAAVIVSVFEAPQIQRRAQRESDFALP